MKIRNVLLPVCFLILFVFGANSSVFAQEEESSATLEETIDSITAKINSHGKVLQYGTTPFVFTFKSLGECKVQINLVAQPDTNYEFRRTTTFSLSDMDPEGISINKEYSGKNGAPFYITLTTFHLKEVIDVYGTHDNAGKPYKSSGANLSIEGSEMANRVIKAFKHAIKLCGGKVDPF